MKDPELHKLARDIVDRRVFGTWELQDHPEDAGMVFLPLGFLDDMLVKRVKASAHIFEYMDRAASQSFDGKPAFYSFRMIGHSDWDRLKAIANPLLEQRKTFLHDRA